MHRKLYFPVRLTMVFGMKRGLLRATLRFGALMITCAFWGCHSPAKTPMQKNPPFWSNWLPWKKTRPPVATAPEWAGVVRMVNIAENFALIESSGLTPPISGAKYISINKTHETGVLRMTPMKNSPFFIADIISGNPSPGDRIHPPGKENPVEPLVTEAPLTSPKKSMDPEVVTYDNRPVDLMGDQP